MSHSYTGFKTVDSVVFRNENVFLKFENEMVSHNMGCLESIHDRMGYGKDVPKEISKADLFKICSWLRGKEVRCRINNTSLQITDIQVATLIYKSRK